MGEAYLKIILILAPTSPHPLFRLHSIDKAVLHHALEQFHILRCF